MRRLLNLFLVLFVLTNMSFSVFAFSVEDFLAPASGGTTELKGPVNETDGIIEAQTAQDGFNYANQTLKKLGSGFSQVMFGSGLGYVAGATESYKVFENVNATQQSKRLAYVKAYTKAKAQLAEGLSGLTGIGYDKLKESSNIVDTADQTLVNNESSYSENINQLVQALIRGYVVYEVKDDVSKNQVYVSVATSQKSLAAVNNISGAVIECNSLRDGLEYVFQQITQGIVPPSGSKVITIPNTGEVAVVSFGSDIIRHHERPDVERTLLQASERAAKVRAQDAMIGIMQGDQITWETGLQSSLDESTKEFREIVDQDKTVHYEKLEETQNRFLHTFKQTSDYNSFRAGKLPPGVITQLYTDDYWVYAVSVYIPSLSEQTDNFYQQMLQIPKNPGAVKVSDQYEPGKGQDIQQGPTGRVTSPDDL